MKLGFVIDNPDLMKEWDWTKNDALGLYPEKITLGSNKKVFWKCKKCGHSWDATTNNRTRGKGQGCPVCANKILIKGKNDLKTKYHEIAKKWHPTKNEKKVDEVFPHSCSSAWWLCEKDNRHEFLAKISHVTEGRITCPVCANQKIIVGVNDLATTHPDLLKEWDYEKNKLTPQQVTYGKNVKVWWKCLKGHSWFATIASRAGAQKTGCPECKKELRISLPEKALAFYLAQTFPIEESKHFPFLKNKKEIDIFIPSLKLGIEYDGQQWHKKTELDFAKDCSCNVNDLRLLRVREEGCPIYNTSAYIVRVPVFGDKIAQLKELISIVFSFINETFATKLNTSPDIEKDYLEIVSKVLTIPKEKSVAGSSLIAEWNYEKNGNLNPALLSIGAHDKVWWKCREGHEWVAAIYSRASGIGCPYCSGKKVLPGWNDLQTLYPEIAKEWDGDKNELLPSQVRPQSNKIVWWRCQKCSHEWLAAISHRVRGRNCPKCGRNITIASHFKAIKNMETGTVYPSIKQAATELHIHANSISNCVRGIRKTAGGYHWHFVDGKEKD